MKMRRCVDCGRRRPLRKLNLGNGRCAYWQGRCLNLFMGTKSTFVALGYEWPHRKRKEVHWRGA